MDHLSNRTLIVMGVIGLFVVGVSWLIDNGHMELTTFAAVFAAVIGGLGGGAVAGAKMSGRSPPLLDSDGHEIDLGRLVEALNRAGIATTRETIGGEPAHAGRT